ncbi:MAG TPA: CcoQ/FixQ family Cbb3-type cytochrome c oxidase assembly chaperone [Verrucomicrobiae bacterium]|nr:CcoQ/FixQ family Cbb3-type cytochrome c oxidase assembly chaperone [Verrucomicrobiae bacterium]
MVENVLQDIEGVGLYGVISICIFFAVFIAAITWMMSLKKADLNSMSQLPLQDGSIPANRPQSKITNHE